MPTIASKISRTASRCAAAGPPIGSGRRDHRTYLILMSAGGPVIRFGDLVTPSANAAGRARDSRVMTAPTTTGSSPADPVGWAGRDLRLPESRSMYVDAEYVEHRSLLFVLRTLARAAGAVLRGGGAY